MTALRFEILVRCRSSRARAGRVETLHGSFDTPAFMPVGTKASVKGLTPAQVRGTGTQILLNNAWHLLLRPGDGLIARRGGSHAFMRWDGPILTDSGGYQAFSLADRSTLDEDGVLFRSIVDGALIRLSPERSIEIQRNLGADIIMAFDDCPPALPAAADGDPDPMASIGRPVGSIRDAPPLTGAGTPPRWRGGRRGGRAPRNRAEYAQRLRDAHDRTVRWLARCVAAHRSADRQALFGIVQGGTDLALREEAASVVTTRFDLPGYAIGGVAVGEGPAQIRSVVAFTAPRLPDDRPRYLMGVGYERDIVAAVRAGVDMFDCVLPTRNGRNAYAFTQTGRLHLRNAAHAEDDRPIESGCDCEACAGGFSRAYLRHLFQADEMLGPTLVSIHNVRHFQRLMLDIRRAIRDDGWSCFARRWPVAGLPAAEAS
ncbi:MAG: tRNA-guanine transglycosylase [Phycisphaeraceae bacterium]|nr:tRNA-guanine transglycosylase [Phycisphaeraceae bacterium]